VNRILNILVIVDPTAAEQPAVAKAALLAEAFNARVELFVCETNASRELRLASHLRERPTAPFVVNLKGMLETLAAPLRARGLDVSTEVERSAVLHQAVTDRIKRAPAGLVVKDTHHHSLARRTLLTNTDWQLIRACPVPLLLVKSLPWAYPPRVLAAIDPGHANDKPAALDHCILQQASIVSKQLQGELHVVHAYIPAAVLIAAASVMPVGTTITSEEIAKEEESKRKEIAALISGYGVPSRNVRVETGGTAVVLPRTAEWLKADIMVLGVIARSGLTRLFIGSTAEDVLDKLPCDALIVKPSDFAERDTL
jgi:universal stress protein E